MVSFKLKIVLALFLTSVFLSVALGISAHSLLNRNLFRDLQTRVRDLTSIGSLTLDRGALERLVHEVRPGMTKGESEAIERSPDYAVISAELNRIRKTDPNLIRLIYTFVPTVNAGGALYLVDADMLKFLSARAHGVEAAEEDIFSPGTELDVSSFPTARMVLATGKAAVGPAYVWNSRSKVNSLSGYAPIFDSTGRKILAVLALDLTDREAKAELRRATTLSVLIGSLALAGTFIVSLFVANLFTRDIVDLDRVVRSFAEDNLHLRAAVRSRDEIGRLGDSFNRMADLIQRSAADQAALLGAYGRFVPRDFLRHLEKESILDVKLGDQVQKEMTILFSDIQSFTELSESMTPRENFNFINSYLSRVGPEIRSHHGFIDKYIGDAIMALFPDRAEDAVEAAVAMQHRVREYNGHRASTGYRAIRVGVGIHTGKLMLGTVGEDERMDGSVIADAVNLCSRIESLTRIYGGMVLISGSALGIIEDMSRYHSRFIDRVRVHGRQESVTIYEVFDGDSEEQFELKSLTRADWDAAVQLYHAQSFREALAGFRDLTARNPNDTMFGIYAARCERLIELGVPENWHGVEVYDSK